LCAPLYCICKGVFAMAVGNYSYTLKEFAILMPKEKMKMTYANL